MQATNNYLLTSTYQFELGWDNNLATFEMVIVANNLHVDYQLVNGYGYESATMVLEVHRGSFVTESDLISCLTVRIPVGWWTAQDPHPPSPFIGGSLVALDRAFSWVQQVLFSELFSTAIDILDLLSCYNIRRLQLITSYFFCGIRTYDLKCIIDLHAAPGSQNGMEHSASRMAQ